MRHTTIVVVLVVGCGVLWRAVAGASPRRSRHHRRRSPTRSTEAQLATVTLSEDAEKAPRHRSRDRDGRNRAADANGRRRGDRRRLASTSSSPRRSRAPCAGRRGPPGARVRKGRRSSRSSRCRISPPERDVGIEAQRRSRRPRRSSRPRTRAWPATRAAAEGRRDQRAAVEEARAQRDVIAARLTAARARAVQPCGRNRRAARRDRGPRADRRRPAGRLGATGPDGRRRRAAVFRLAGRRRLGPRARLRRRAQRAGSDAAGRDPRVGSDARTRHRRPTRRRVRRRRIPPPRPPICSMRRRRPTPACASASGCKCELPLRASQKALVVPDAALLYDFHGGTWVYETTRQSRLYPHGASRSADKPAAR